MTAMAVLSWAMLVMSGNSLVIPVDDLAKWTEAVYRGIPPNQVVIENGKLSVKVNNSSSPLIYRFEEPVRLKGFSVEASWDGALRIPAGVTQGENGADDFVLKFGLVVAGDKTLNWLQRRIAADWIVRLHELAPEGRGIENVRFYSTTLQLNLVGSTRTHPLSELFYEERLEYLAGPGSFSLARTFKDPVDTLGLWISSDGDDTASELEVKIHKIVLQLVD